MSYGRCEGLSKKYYVVYDVPDFEDLEAAEEQAKIFNDVFKNYRAPSGHKIRFKVVEKA